MGYTKFCNGYADYTIVNKLTNHFENKSGVKAEIDWSGPTMCYIDTSTGEVITVYLFVGTLPYSQYSYVEPTLDMKMDSFIRAHVHMYEFFEGVHTRLIWDKVFSNCTIEGHCMYTAFDKTRKFFIWKCLCIDYTAHA